VTSTKRLDFGGDHDGIQEFCGRGQLYKFCW